MNRRNNIQHIQRRIEQLSEWLLEHDLLFRKGKISEQQYNAVRELYESELDANIKEYYRVLRETSTSIRSF